jgi:THO complex subunit 5
MRVNKARIQTHEEKNKIDEFHLELQNLLYEISHYKKEINKCHEFRSLDEEINLVSVEEFYSKSPIDVSNPVGVFFFFLFKFK